MIKDIIDGKEIILTKEILFKYSLKALLSLKKSNSENWDNDDLNMFQSALEIRKKESFEYLDKFFKEI